MLPVDEKYLPSLKIDVRDNRAFGRKPVVASFELDDIEKYLVDTPAIKNKPGTPPEPDAPPGSPVQQPPDTIEVAVQLSSGPSAPSSEAAASGEPEPKPKNKMTPRDKLDSGTIAPAAVR